MFLLWRCFFKSHKSPDQFIYHFGVCGTAFQTWKLVSPMAFSLIWYDLMMNCSLMNCSDFYQRCMTLVPRWIPTLFVGVLASNI